MDRYVFQDGVPKSYKDILPDGSSYWGSLTYARVGALDCNGTRVPMDSQIAIEERTLVHEGLNLYDAATWQIAISLWRLWEYSEAYERNVLYTSSTGGAFATGDETSKHSLPGLRAGLLNIRADGDNMIYGENNVKGSSLMQMPYPGNSTHFKQDPDTGLPALPAVKKGPGAYFYRMIGPHYFLKDPLQGLHAASWKDPWPVQDPSTKWNGMGYIHWNDWKPITGENAWACLIGPIQTLAIKTGGNLTNTTCGSPQNPLVCDFQTWDTTPSQVQLAISVLPAMEALLTQLGALFHCPSGAKIYPPDPDEGNNVSNENNFSTYAGLKMLQAVLKNYSSGSTDQYITYAQTTTDKLVKALDGWFENYLLSAAGELPDGDRLVYQGGHIYGTKYNPVKLTTVGGVAVDCQTWGMTVMGAPRMDALYGNGTAYNVWQATKKTAGYYRNGKIAGVGYTSQINGSSIAPQNSIWSAEWTFGAINMAQVLAGQYRDAGDLDKYDSLMADADSMLQAVTQQWPSGLQFSDGSYVYANQRFFIPWGWFSNPIGSLCSTAWSIMQEQNFNPFEFGGGNKPSIDQWRKEKSMRRPTIY